MKRKNFEIKEGKHLAFRDMDLKRDGKESRFLRAESLGIHYTEEAIKFRLTNKEQYRKMTDNKFEIKRQKEAEKAKFKEVQAKNMKRHTREWTL